MAEGDGTCYNQFKKLLLQGDVDLANDILKICLLGSGYSFNPDNAHGYSDMSANEISATGYSAGGETLGSKTITQNNTLDRAKFDAGDVTWTSLAATTIAHAVIYDDTLTAAPADTALIRFEIATNSNGGNYQLSFHSDGILLLS